MPHVAPRPAPADFGELEEIEVEVQEPPPPPAPERANASFVSPAGPVGTEGGGLTFLKFENPFVAPDGHVVLPALFLDGAGNPVRLRLRISMEEDRH